jgi:hypothetical protein
VALFHVFFSLGKMLIHDQAITILFDVDDTMRTGIELNELFETESDGLTISVLYALKVDWRPLLATRVHGDMVIPKLYTPTVAWSWTSKYDM